MLSLAGEFARFRDDMEKHPPETARALENAFMFGAFVGLHSLTAANDKQIIKRYEEALAYIQEAARKAAARPAAIVVNPETN